MRFRPEPTLLRPWAGAMLGGWLFALAVPAFGDPKDAPASSPAGVPGEAAAKAIAPPEARALLPRVVVEFFRVGSAGRQSSFGDTLRKAIERVAAAEHLSAQTLRPALTDAVRAILTDSAASDSERASAAFLGKKWKDALEAAERVIGASRQERLGSQSPPDAARRAALADDERRALLIKGTALLGLEKPGEAETAIQGACDLTEPGRNEVWWAAHQALAKMLHDRSESQDCLDLYKKMVAAHDSGEHPAGQDLPDLLTFEAMTYSALAQPEEALAAAQRAVQAAEKEFGAQDRRTYPAVYLLSLVQANNGNSAEAVQLLDRSLRLATADEPAGELAEPDDLLMMGDMYSSARLPGRAGQYYQRALDLAEKREGPEDPKVVEMLLRIAGSHLRNGEYQPAEEMARRARTIAGHESTGLQEMEADQILARTLACQGQLREAIPLYDEAIERLRKSVGAEHPEVGSWLSEVGGMYITMGDLANGEKRLHEALAIYRKTLSADDPRTADLLRRVGEMLCRQQKFDEAEQLTRESLAMIEKHDGRENPRLLYPLMVLAEIQWGRFNYSETEKTYQRAIEVAHAGLHPNPRDVIFAEMSYAHYVMAWQQWTKAEKMLRDLRALAEKSFGRDSTDVAYIETELSKVLAQEEKYEEAVPLLRKSLVYAEKAVGPGRDEVDEYRYFLGAALLSMKTYEEGERVMQQVLAREEGKGATNTYRYAVACEKLGVALMEQNKRGGVPLLRKSVTAFETSHSPVISVARARYNLGNCLARQQEWQESERSYRQAKKDLAVSKRPDDSVAGLIDSELACVLWESAAHPGTPQDLAYAEEHKKEARQLIAGAYAFLVQHLGPADQSSILAKRRMEAWGKE